MSKVKVYGVPDLTKKQKGLILVALALVFFFNNGDTSLLSAAAPTILADIGGSNLYALIFSAKMLTNAVFMMLCGKLSDKFGRRNVMVFGIALIFAGYLGGGFSANMAQMIVWRAITGVGSGLSFGLGYTILGDLFSGASYGAAYIVQICASAAACIGGPMLGGVLATYLPWHWCFWVLVPLTVITFILLLAVCPNYRLDTAQTKLDRSGMILFALGMSTLLFALSVAGSFFAWTSPIIIGSFVVAAVLLVLFFWHEAKTDRRVAVFPVSLMKNRGMSVSCVGQLCMTLNSLCLLTYIPYFIQSGMGHSASTSGNVLATIYAASTIGGIFITRQLGKNSNYGFWARFTVLGESLGLILVVVLLKPSMPLTLLIAICIIYGLFASVEGTAFIMTSQSTLSPAQMAAGTSCITFIQALASLLGSAVGGTIINSSADFVSGIHNVFLFAAIITVVGAVVVTILMPGKARIEQIRARAIADDEQAV